MKVELTSKFNPGDVIMDIKDEDKLIDVVVVDVKWREHLHDFYYLVEYPDRTRKWIGELSDYLCEK